MKPIEHFLDLAKSGGNRMASSGEVRARRLADCVLEHVGGLDDNAFAGLIEFIREARLRPMAARSALGGELATAAR